MKGLPPPFGFENLVKESLREVTVKWMKGVKEISLSQFSVEMFLFQYQQHVNVFVVGYESRCGNRLKVCFLFCLFWVLQWLRYIKHWFIFIYRICFYWKTLKTLLSDMWLLAKAILFSKRENPGNMLQTIKGC